MSNVRSAVMAVVACCVSACTGAIEADESAAIQDPRDVGTSEAAVGPVGAAPVTTGSPPNAATAGTPVVPAPSAMMQAAPTPVSPVPAAQPVTPASPPVGAAASLPSSEMTAVVSAFDAGSGTMQPDGKTVIFHIADGTGGMDWNTMAKPVRVQHGMTLRLIDDDTTKQHFLHTLGQPCTHGSRAIGTGYDCVVGANVPMGLVNGVYDHNGANGGRGRFFVEVVQ